VRGRAATPTLDAHGDWPPPTWGAGEPVLIPLNRGWGDRALLDAGIAWSARVGRPLTLVYVIVSDGPARRLQLRAAGRALRLARRRRGRDGAGVAETLVRAESVPDGLRLAADASGGVVGSLAADGASRARLEAAGIPVCEVGGERADLPDTVGGTVRSAGADPW
jgi:hypothetical protein